MKDTTKASLVRCTLIVCITCSIAMMYYQYIIKGEYAIFTNPDGPVLDEN